MVTDVNWTYCGDHLKYIQILNRHTLHLKLTSCYANYTLI